MTTMTIDTDPTIHAPAAPAGARLAAWLRRLLATVSRSVRRRRMRDALVGLDDRMLKDIGVKRSEIDYLASVLTENPARQRPYY